MSSGGIFKKLFACDIKRYIDKKNLKIMNKCKAPKIPPLLVNNIFVLNYREKAKLLTVFFFTAMLANAAKFFKK